MVMSGLFSLNPQNLGEKSQVFFLPLPQVFYHSVVFFELLIMFELLFQRQFFLPSRGSFAARPPLFPFPFLARILSRNEFPMVPSFNPTSIRDPASSLSFSAAFVTVFLAQPVRDLFFCFLFWFLTFYLDALKSSCGPCLVFICDFAFPQPDADLKYFFCLFPPSPFFDDLRRAAFALCVLSRTASTAPSLYPDLLQFLPRFSP